MLRRKKRTSLLVSFAIAASLMGSSLPSAYASDSGAQAVMSSIGKVDLNSSSYAEVKQVNLLSDQNGNIVTFTITITNNGSSDLKFSDYWVRLRTKSGSQFSVKMMPQDKDKNVVPAGSSQDFAFYSAISDATQLQDLTFRIIKWDFSVDNFERILGDIPVPSSFTNVIPAGSSQVAVLAGTNVELTVSKFTRGKNDKYNLPNITLQMKNVDSHSITVPAYQFAIRTSEGYTYPLEAKGLKDLSIDPQDTKEITLSGAVPSAVSTDGWQLVITQNLADLNMDIPIAFFQLPPVSDQEVTEAGKEVQFSDDNGEYTAKLNGMYRLPWGDQDILSAGLTLSNQDSDSLPLPNLTGYFLLDGAVKVDANIVTPAKVIGLPKGASIDLQMAAKVPYTYDFAKVQLVLQETSADGSKVDVLEFEMPSEVLNVPIKPVGESYSIEDPGYRSEFSVQSVAKYEGESDDLFTAQVLVNNKEKRYTNIAGLVANLRSADGYVFPATVAEVKDKVAPAGKALLYVTSVLPKDFPTSGLNLLLGEAVANGKLTGGGAADGAADMYINPFAFWLPKENSEIKTGLQNIHLAPYTLSINHVGTSLDTDKLTVKFDYEITKDTSSLTNTDNRKIVFRLEDGNGLSTMEWSCDLSSLDQKAGDTPQTPQSNLRVGKYQDFKVNIQNSDLIYKLSFLKSYHLNVYEEISGHRKLLASMKNDWFVTSD